MLGLPPRPALRAREVEPVRGAHVPRDQTRA